MSKELNFWIRVIASGILCTLMLEVCILFVEDRMYVLYNLFK